MDETFTDIGLGATTGNSSDNGKFKSNTLRNIEFTAPYMHDGRFSTLEEVVEFYSFGVQATSPNIDPLMKKAQQGGIQLSASERAPHQLRQASAGSRPSQAPTGCLHASSM